MKAELALCEVFSYWLMEVYFAASIRFISKFLQRGRFDEMAANQIQQNCTGSRLSCFFYHESISQLVRKILIEAQRSKVPLLRKYQSYVYQADVLVLVWREVPFLLLCSNRIPERKDELLSAGLLNDGLWDSAFLKQVAWPLKKLLDFMGRLSSLPNV